jgi:predicted nucleic acid-binding protein
MRVFVDSDVVISSLISSRGAAHFLLNQPSITPVISSISHIELRKVVERMNLDMNQLELLIKNDIEVFSIFKELKELKNEYHQFVTDINDAHIVAGAHISKVKYLVTYNLRHFKVDKIKDKLNILVLTPALFLQFQRSQS